MTGQAADDDAPRAGSDDNKAPLLATDFQRRLIARQLQERPHLQRVLDTVVESVAHVRRMCVCM